MFATAGLGVAGAIWFLLWQGINFMSLDLNTAIPQEVFSTTGKRLSYSWVAKFSMAGFLWLLL